MIFQWSIHNSSTTRQQLIDNPSKFLSKTVIKNDVIMHEK